MTTPRLRDVYPSGTRVADRPVLQVVDDFVGDDACRHVIALGSERLGAAMVSAVGPATTSDGRTGSVAWIRHDETPMVAQLVERICSFVDLPPAHAESLQVVHYGETQEYRPHHDAYDSTTEKGRQRTVRGGQRVLTALVHLADVPNGGATVFPRLDIEIEARRGRLVVFHNVLDPSLCDVTRDPDALHASTQVRSGEKWACNLWFRQFPY